MVTQGSLQSWQPVSGEVITWTATPASKAALARAQRNPLPPSFQQATHLRAAFYGNEMGRPMPRLIVASWDIPGVCDVAAMSEAINAHVRRHDTYHSTFEFENDDIVRRTIDDPQTIEMTPHPYGYLSTEQIRAHVPSTTPGTLHWDCFSFGAIQGSDHFTFYASVDHLNSDGMSAGPIFLDIHLRYHDLVAGRTVAAPAVGGYLDYTARQREHVANTTDASQEIQDWTTFAEDADGDWPSFPLSLGDTSTDSRGDLVTVELLTAEETEAFDMACRDAGARFSGGVMACAAMAEREFTGKTVFRGFTPSDTRTVGVDTLTAGWFASLFPVTVTMGDGTFGDAARAAQESFDANRSMASVPFERVLELTPADQLGVKLPSQPPMMVSYLDFRRIPVASLWDETNFGIYCDDLSHGGINMWINRDAERTTAAISFPDNEVARASVHRYLAALGTAFTSAASTTESRPQTPALAGELAANYG